MHFLWQNRDGNFWINLRTSTLLRGTSSYVQSLLSSVADEKDASFVLTGRSSEASLEFQSDHMLRDLVTKSHRRLSLMASPLTRFCGDLLFFHFMLFWREREEKKREKRIKINLHVYLETSKMVSIHSHLQLASTALRQKDVDLVSFYFFFIHSLNYLPAFHYVTQTFV